MNNVELLEVPEELKGQLVKTIAEYLLQLINLLRSVRWIVTIEETMLLSVLDILNQPFTPEMLEKYFEIKTNFIIWLSKDNQEFEILRATRQSQYIFPYPKTLAQFIEYCSDCEIELKWKGSN